MTRARIGITVFAVGLVLAPVAPLEHVASGQASLGSGLAGFQDWLDLARRHVPGRLDPALLQERDIPVERHFSLDVDLEALIEFVRDPNLQTLRKVRRIYSRTEQEFLKRIAAIERAAGTTDSLLKRIAVLESDGVMLSGGKKFLVVPASSKVPRDMILSTDGVGLDVVVTPPNWRIARRAIDAMSAEPAVRGWIHQWYTATTAYLFYDHMLSVIPEHVANWQRVLPADGEAWFHEGCLFEALADDRIQHAVADSRRKRHPVEVQNADWNLGSARRRFEQTLERDSRHVEARLRLARVKALQGEAAAAIREFSALLPDLGSDRELVYLAELFLGAAHESSGDHAKARTAYAEAWNLYPHALSPRISRLGLDPPSGGASEDALAELLRKERLRSDDPWLSYHLGPGRFARNLATALWDASRGVTSPGSRKLQ